MSIGNILRQTLKKRLDDVKTLYKATETIAKDNNSTFVPKPPKSLLTKIKDPSKLNQLIDSDISDLKNYLMHPHLAYLVPQKMIKIPKS